MFNLKKCFNYISKLMFGRNFSLFEVIVPKIIPKLGKYPKKMMFKLDRNLEASPLTRKKPKGPLELRGNARLTLKKQKLKKCRLKGSASQP